MIPKKSFLWALKKGIPELNWKKKQKICRKLPPQQLSCSGSSASQGEKRCPSPRVSVSVHPPLSTIDTPIRTLEGSMRPDPRPATQKKAQKMQKKLRANWWNCLTRFETLLWKISAFNWIILNFWRLSCLSPEQLAWKKRASNTTNFMIFIMPIPMSTARSGVWCLLRTLTWKFTSRGLHFALLSVLKWNFQPTLPLVAACLGFVCAKFGLHWR